MHRLHYLAAATVALVFLAGCSSTWLPHSGPSRGSVVTESAQSGVLVVDASEAATRKLLASQHRTLFSEALPSEGRLSYGVGKGDGLEISVLEAPPGLLFANVLGETRGAAASAARATVFPEQIIDGAGTISVPFAGTLAVDGMTLQQIEAAIAERLRGKANQPQVVVRLVRNTSSTVTVVGEVGRSARVPLTPRGERLLDALAEAGGVRQPVNKTSVQITRGERVVTLPLETVISDPRQNIPLRPGDVITALHQPLSLSVLGATGRNEELSFEVQGITLAQTLARAGGLQDNRANATGVFIFRFEDPRVFAKTGEPLPLNADGRVPVIYTFNLLDPGTFFTAQNFPMRNRDVLYVANADAANLQKFLTVVGSVIYPFDVINRIRQ
jgi:polysaccharide biosynthesis/export protein